MVMWPTEAFGLQQVWLAATAYSLSERLTMLQELSLSGSSSSSSSNSSTQQCLGCKTQHVVQSTPVSAQGCTSLHQAVAVQHDCVLTLDREPLLLSS